MPFRWRPDGDYVRDIPPTRKILPFIMRGRNESIVFFEQKIDTTQTWAFLRNFRDRTGLHATLLHLLIWVSAQILDKRPRQNRFTAGGRNISSKPKGDSRFIRDLCLELPWES